MNSKIVFFTLLLILSSCSNNKIENSTPQVKSLEEIAMQHVKFKLSMNNSEKFTMKIYKEHLDGDDKIDAIITVNRLDLAYEKANKSNKTAKLAEIGFVGNYNYIFFYDGGLDLISPPTLIPSSALSELRVEFKNITTAAYKDILIDFKLLNSNFKDYFTIINHSPIQVFQWETYRNIGTDSTKALYFEYDEGTVGLAKDILIFEGKIDNLSELKEHYKFDAKISKSQSGKLIHRFMYFENEGKYFTKK